MRQVETEPETLEHQVIRAEFQRMFRQARYAVAGVDLKHIIALVVSDRKGVVAAAHRVEVILEGGFQIGVGDEPVQVARGPVQHALKTQAPGLVHIGEQAGGASGGLKQDVIVVGGMEEAQVVVGRAQLAAQARLKPFGNHIFKGRIRQEGVRQAALKFHIILILACFTGGDDGASENAVVASQFNGGGRAGRFAVVAVDVHVLRRLPSQPHSGVEAEIIVFAIEFGAFAGEVRQIYQGVVQAPGQGQGKLLCHLHGVHKIETGCFRCRFKIGSGLLQEDPDA